MTLLVLALALSATPEAAARSHYAAALGLYRAADYRAAASELRAAYELSPSADLAFDLAQSLRLAGQGAEAVRFYRIYLSAQPEAKDAGIVRGTVESLEREGAPAPAETVSGALPPTRRARARWPAYGAAAITAGIFVAAGITGFLAQGTSQTLLGSVHPNGQATALYRTTETFATVANVLYAVGGVAAAGTGALILWDFQ